MFSEWAIKMKEKLQNTSFEDFVVVEKLGGLQVGGRKSAQSFDGWNSVVVKVRYEKEVFAMKIMKVAKDGDFSNFKVHNSNPSDEYLSNEIQRRTGIPFHKNVVPIIHSFLYEFSSEQLESINFNFHPYDRNTDLNLKTTVLVMEAYDMSLKKFVKKRLGIELSEKEFLKIAVDVLQGACHIHKNGFVHRDIKMENIFLRESDGSAAIGDFCWLMNCSEYSDFIIRTKKHYPCGYPKYIPNEMLIKKGKTIDYSKVDAFAVGRTLYKLLEGKEAYPGGNNYSPKVQSKFRKIHRKDVSEEVKSIVRGLCKVEMKERWTLDEALEAALTLKKKTIE